MVVLDLRMPGVDGYEVCRRIKSKPETAHIAVIAMTAIHSPEAVARIIECGARMCLPKPLDIPALLEEVDSAVQQRDPAARTNRSVRR